MTVALDFDGVLHKYSRGYGDGTIYDQPTPGMVRAVRAVLQVEAAFVLTARRNVNDVADWLRGAGLPAFAGDGVDAGVKFWDTRNLLLVTNRKLPARKYVDDRAVLFAGDWGDTLEELGIYVPEAGPLALVEKRLHELHPRDVNGFCETCRVPGSYDEAETWPCPSLRLFLSPSLGGVPGALTTMETE